MTQYYGELDDGTASLGHNGFDRESWDRALDLNDGLHASLSKRDARFPTVRAFARDLFWSFYQWRPKVAPPVPLLPSHRPHARILRQIMDTPEWQALRARGTPHDTLIASYSTVGMAQKIFDALPDQDKAAMRKAHGCEQRVNGLKHQVDAIEQRRDAATDQDSKERLGRALTRARDQLQDQEAKLEEATPELSDDGVDAARQAFRQAAEQAEERVGDMEESAFAYGIGSGRGPGVPLSDDEARERLQLAERLRTSAFLKRVAELAGRKIRVALAMQETRLDRVPTTVTTIGLGDDIQRTLPSDLALLGSPATAGLFHAKHADAALLTYALEGKAPAGRGPIIVAVDESGSMAGEPLAWAKAVTLALIAVAKQQNRAVRVISFASRDETQCWDFDNAHQGHAITPSRLIDLASHNFDGGTDFESWMELALAAATESAYDKADVVVVTDGIASPSPDLLKRWNDTRTARGMRVQGINVGYGYYSGTEAVFEAMTDSNHLLSKSMAGADGLDGALFTL